MSIKTGNKIIICLVLLGAGLWGRAQDKINIKASADKRQILIGEQILLTFEAEIPEHEAISFFSFDTLPHFEILEKQKIDTSNTITGTVLRQLVRITSFDSGHWVIPSLQFNEELSSDSIPIDVSFSSPFDSSQAYHDIKDVLDVKVEEQRQTWWLYAAAGGLLLLILLVWVLTRKKKPVKEQAAAEVNPYDEAMQALDKLDSGSPDIKQYYSALVDIFRLYISRKKGISSLQKTTDDLVVQLKTLSMRKDEFDRLAQSLRLSDFVKFAKYLPAPADNKSTLETIRASIKTIENTSENTAGQGQLKT